MPNYDYVCDSCGHEMEVFQRMSDDALTECPACGEAALRRLIGAGAGIIFRGSGFYETDYKRAGSSKSEGESKSSSSSDAKSESKSESKPSSGSSSSSSGSGGSGDSGSSGSSGSSSGSAS